MTGGGSGLLPPKAQSAESQTGRGLTASGGTCRPACQAGSECLPAVPSAAVTAFGPELKSQRRLRRRSLAQCQPWAVAPSLCRLDTQIHCSLP